MKNYVYLCPIETILIYSNVYAKVISIIVVSRAVNPDES